MTLTPELEASLRNAINPIYASWPGTESHERAALLREIDRLRAIVAHLTVPVGYKLVPVRATEQMLQAAENAEADFVANGGMWCGLQDYYKAMVKAAPNHN